MSRKLSIDRAADPYTFEIVRLRGENAKLRAALERSEETNEQLMEQIALRQPSVVERDMQLVMQINNRMQAALERQLEAHNYQEVLDITRAALEETK